MRLGHALSAATAIVAIAPVAPGLSRADVGPPKPTTETAAEGAFVAELELEASLEAGAALSHSVGYHLTEKATLWGNEVGSQLNLLTLDLVDLDFDVGRRYANVRVGAMAQSIGFKVDGNIVVRGNVARVKTSLALGLGGQTYELELPVFEVTTQNVAGERSVELRVPIIEGRF